jgi:predicted Zn-dependent peptidase
MAWVTPRLGAPGDVELDLAAAILVDRGSGWLEQALLASPRLCTRVVARQASRAMASVFEIDAVVADGRSAVDAARGIASAMRRFEQGVSDEDIQRARVVFQRGRLFGMESSMGLAQQLASASKLGALPPVYDGQIARYASITPEAVRHAVNRYLGVRPWVIAYGLPVRGASLEGELMGRVEAAW